MLLVERGSSPAEERRLAPIQMDALEPIIQQATTGKIIRPDAESVCAAENMQMADLYNQIALIVAKRFHNGSLCYEDGDAAMNAIFIMMTDDAVNGDPRPYVEPAWSIYLAFDEGEYDHGGSTHPVERFTRPQIRNILSGAQQIVGSEQRKQ